MGKQIKADDQISDSIMERAKEEEKYYNNLYDFAIAVSRANERSFEGEEPKKIANGLRKVMNTFLSLCLYSPDSIDVGCKNNTVMHTQKAAEEVKREEEKKKEEVKEEETKTKLRLISGKFLEIDSEGWGLCPECTGKVLKVTEVTRIENFPVYCKKCKAEHVVNWWNAKKQRIVYKRYVNDSAIRQSALKGTSFRSFQNSGSSATERAAIRE